MADRQLKFVLTGEDKSASSTMGKVGASGESASQKIGGAFTKLGSTIGGEFGEVLNKVGEGLDKLGENGQNLGKKFAVGGAAVMGVGLLLTAAGSKEKQATDQLKAAVDATGASYSDYSEEIEKTVKHEENYAHSAVDTKTALQTLTTATGDTKKALDQMQVVTDLAAAKHESLSEAASQVAKILGGSGGKILTQYGIKMKTNADGTKDAAGALDELGQKLQGQASASMNNFGAKVDEVKTKIGDWVGEMGQKFGPVLTVAGTVIGAVAGGMEILAARAERAAAAETELAAAETKSATAGAAAAAGSAAAAAGNTEVAVSSEAAKASTLAAVGGVAALAAAAYGVGTLLKGPIQQLTGQTDGFGAAMSHAAGITDTFKQALIDSGGAVTANVSSIAALQLQQSGLADKAAKSGISLGDMTKAVTGSDEQFNALIDTWKKSGDPSGKTILNLIAMRDAFTGGQDGAKKYADALNEASTETADTAAQQKTLQTQLSQTKTSAFGTTAQLGFLNDALDKLSNNSIDAQQQELHLKDALGQASDTLKGNGSAIGDNTAKGRANQEWVLDQIRAINTHVTAVGKQTGSVRQATSALASDTAQLRAAATAAGLNKSQVDALIRSYAATPKKIKTQIDADTAAAKRKIADLQAQIDALRGKTVPIILEQRVTGDSGRAAQPAEHAAGGYLSEGWNTAGEGSDTELMYKQGSNVKVLTHQQAAPRLASAGSVTNNFYVTVPYGGAGAAGREIVQILEQHVAQGGTVTVGRGIR